MPGSAFVMVFDTTASGSASLFYSTYLAVPPELNYPSPSAAHYEYPDSNGYSIAVDSFGKAYVTGHAPPGFPVTPGAFQTAHAPYNGNLLSSNAFIAKLDPFSSGSQSLIYSTLLGGKGGTSVNAIAVDTAGNAYVTGVTNGSYYGSFPVTPGAFQTTVGQNSYACFVTKFNAAGSKLVYSTFLSDTFRYTVGNAIVVDPLGNAYIAGQVNSPYFPVTPDAFQSTYIKFGGSTDYGSAFLSKLNPTGSALIYSSYLGGSYGDGASALAIDTAGDAYLAGYTSSPDFPHTNFSFQPAMKGTGDAFVTKFPLGADNLPLSISSIVPSSGGNAGTLSACAKITSHSARRQRVIPCR